MQRAILKPAPGRLVRHPATRRPLREAGEPVMLDAFWRRRIRRGDVQVLERLRGETPKTDTGDRADETEG